MENEEIMKFHPQSGFKIFTSLLIIFCTISLQQAIGEKDIYKKWLKDEVHLLITQSEAEKFEKIKSEKEKADFIELFWAKRDPTPQTRRNEFKIEYYRRLKYAEKTFSYAGITGSKRSLGKVYIIFGPPKRREGANTWMYDPMPHWNIQTKFKIAYLKFAGGYAVDNKLTSQKAIIILDNFPKISIVNPDLKNISYKNAPILDPESFEGNILQ